MRTILAIVILFGVDIAPLQAQILCGDWQQVQVGEYIVQNNVWGKGNITNYSQCVGGTSAGAGVQAQFQWNWPTGVNSNVKAYPEIIYGQKPDFAASTTPNLPAIVSTSNLRASVAANVSVSGKFNFAFDLWVSPTLPPTFSNVTHEIMIWLKSSGMIPSSNLVDTVQIDGQVYDVYTQQFQWSYIAFNSRSDQSISSKIRLKPFFDYMIARGMVPAQSFLASVELGNEIIDGAGTNNVTLAMSPINNTATHDFNGDGKSDMLWHHSSGADFMNLMNGSVVTSSASLGGDGNWTIVGTGDFDGDGKADILWRHISGAVFMNMMNGGVVTSSASIGGDPGWTIAGTGDFNGDFKPDILWRHISGAVFMNLMNGAVVTSSASLGGDTNWTIAGTGDFNGDGMSDILWRHSSGAVFMNMMNGGTVSSTASLGGDLNWTVIR